MDFGILNHNNVSTNDEMERHQESNKKSKNCLNGKHLVWVKFFALAISRRKNLEKRPTKMLVK